MKCVENTRMGLNPRKATIVEIRMGIYKIQC